MKKLVLSLVAAMATSAAFGQGFISMNSYQANGWLAFYDTVGGARSTTASVGLYYSTTGTIDAGNPGTGWTLAGAPSGVTSTGAAAGWGFVNAASGGGNRDLGAFGQTLYFQLRAWTGGYASWDAALASGNASALRSLVTGGANAAPVIQATTQASASSPVPTINWAPGATSANPLVVNLVPVPEPSTIVLAGLGLLGLIFIRRRK